MGAVFFPILNQSSICSGVISGSNDMVMLTSLVWNNKSLIIKHFTKIAFCNDVLDRYFVSFNR